VANILDAIHPSEMTKALLSCAIYCQMTEDSTTLRTAEAMEIPYGSCYAIFSEFFRKKPLVYYLLA
jgi:hypothetical protein